MTVLGAWSNFYVIIGSGAAALTGLMFVVITIVVGRETGPTREGISAFSTPTVVHFCAALLASALLSIPWTSIVHAAIAVGLVGLFCVGYSVKTIWRARRLTSYEPDLDDWLWHAAMPLVAYIVLVAASVGLAFAPGTALFAIAGAVLALVFVAIHNAWDVVTYLAVEDP